jgi:hypothetical protein
VSAVAAPSWFGAKGNKIEVLVSGAYSSGHHTVKGAFQVVLNHAGSGAEQCESRT